MDILDNTMSTLFKNKYSSVLITMFLVLYSGLAAPKLPNFIMKLFEHPIFRVLILSLIVYNGNKDPQLSIMIAVGFTVTMNILSKQKFFEGFAKHDGVAHDNESRDAHAARATGLIDAGKGYGESARAKETHASKCIKKCSECAKCFVHPELLPKRKLGKDIGGGDLIIDGTEQRANTTRKNNTGGVNTSGGDFIIDGVDQRANTPRKDNTGGVNTGGGDFTVDGSQQTVRENFDLASITREAKKNQLLRIISELKKKGVEFKKSYNFNSPIEEIISVLKERKSVLEKEISHELLKNLKLM